MSRELDRSETILHRPPTGWAVETVSRAIEIRESRVSNERILGDQDRARDEP